MSLCDETLRAQRRKEGEKATALFEAAIEKEREAAEIASAKDDFEPTRSVLLRSAAALAIECGKYRTAEQLIAKGLSGDPPDEIARELRELFEVLLTRPKRGVTITSSIDELPKEERCTIEGTLGVANSKLKQKKIELKRDDGSWLSVVVPEKMMDDIVKPLWAERVQVIGIIRGKTFFLDRIRKVRRRNSHPSRDDDSA